jgi:hypothetical protein
MRWSIICAADSTAGAPASFGAARRLAGLRADGLAVLRLAAFAATGLRAPLCRVDFAERRVFAAAFLATFADFFREVFLAILFAPAVRFGFAETPKGLADVDVAYLLVPGLA